MAGLGMGFPTLRSVTTSTLKSHINMAAQSTTIWDIEPHTTAKHAILRRYLQAWVPILTGSFRQVLYIDGFAGPGLYSEGESGSPIIALKTALARKDQIPANVFFYFVEKEKDRAEMLKLILKEIEIPQTFLVKVFNGTFEEAFAKIYERHKTQTYLPTFAFIDPFGWKGVPFEAVTKILSRRSCEVLVTFMYEEINRFIGQQDQVYNFNRFFGTNAWRKGIELGNPRDRNRFFHDLYLRQLEEVAGARFVRSFEMRNERDVTDYFLFFATNNLLGLKKMKEAMWKVDESGDFRFSDATDPNQLVLFRNEPPFGILRDQILGRFTGTEASVKSIEDFVVQNTAFRETHYKGILKTLETQAPPLLKVVKPPPNRKRGTYTDPNLRLRFLIKPKWHKPIVQGELDFGMGE